MSTSLVKVPVVPLTEGIEAVAVHGPNIKVVVFPSGDVIAHTNGRVTTVRLEAASPAIAPADALSVGAAMPDGTIYAGVSPGTGKPMYTTPEVSALTWSFKRAAKHAAALDAHGHKDWRVPNMTELNVLFGNRAAIGGFNTTGLYAAGRYWSSTRNIGSYAWAQRFSDGCQISLYRVRWSALRCVRG